LTVNENIKTAFQIFEQKRIPRTTFIVNQSEQIGKIAQLSNGFLIKIRNFALRLVPKSIQDKGMDKVLNVDFGENGL
jgi:2-polyprenyl-6-methoxyphenol hydroxylase-like FAD-dependent oxidoreductase